MPIFRKDRHDAIIVKIKANPSCWDQSNWHCCYAGHAQIDSGKTPDNKTARRDARIWLGLTKFEADYLFSKYRTLDQLESFSIHEKRLNYLGNHGFDKYAFDSNGFDRDGLDKDNNLRE